MSIEDAAMASDAHGRVTFANRVSLSLMGRPEAEVAGQPLETVFRILNQFTGATVESPATKALRGVRLGHRPAWPAPGWQAVHADLTGIPAS